MPGSHQEELESARILIRENLLDEAKRILFRLRTRASDPQSSVVRSANELLNEISKIEITRFMKAESPRNREKKSEDPTQLIQNLGKDLQVDSLESELQPMENEIWIVQDPGLSTVERLDLAVAFFEMGCYGDAIRELKKAEKKIRIEESFLGETGVSVVSLHALSLVKLGKAFDAKVYLEPVLLEPDLPHEQKVILYYIMGLAEQFLEDRNSARAWFQKVALSDPDFKDVRQRIRLLSENP